MALLVEETRNECHGRGLKSGTCRVNCMYDVNIRKYRSIGAQWTVRIVSVNCTCTHYSLDHLTKSENDTL